MVTMISAGLNRLFRAAELIGAALLSGLVLGTGVTLANLSEFSLLPDWLAWLFPILAGTLLGLLVPELSRALGALLLMLPIGAAVSLGALVYPEHAVGRLGADIAFELSLVPALRGVLLSAPLSLAGLLLGKVLARGGEHQ
jgi:hypothetical protein